MRTVIKAAGLLLLFLLLWFLFSPRGPGGSSPRSGGVNSGSFAQQSPERPGGGNEAELRIEIREDARRARLQHQEIVARYGRDADAIDWVANCVSDSSPAAEAVAVDQDVLYACWQSYAARAEPDD